MPDTQSKIDSLKELNSQLIATIAELRKENADVKAENTKLKQAMEENAELKSRIDELEKNRTDSNAENAELRVRVAKLEQDFGHVRESDDITIEEAVVIPDPVKNQYINANSKTLENIETDAFLDSEYKKKISNEIRQCNKEKKLLHESMNVTSNSSHDIKTVNIVNDQDSAELAQPRLSHNTEIINNISQEQVQKSITNPTEDLTLVSEFVQGLLQEFSSPGTQLWESIEFCNLATASVSLQKLAHLFYQANTARKNSIKAKREEISSWGCYSERYEDKVIEVRSEDKNLTDKTARSRIYNEMRPYLTGISDGYLRVMTCKARKINKLFGYEYDPVTLKKINGIGWHMVNRVTCSADSISRLTNPQIRYIIDYVTSKTVNIVNDQSHVTSKTGDNQPHVTSKSEVSVSTTPIPSSQIFNSISSKKILESKVSMPSKSQASDSSGSITKISLPLISQPRKIRPYSARASYINTILKDHSYLSLRHSNPRSDSYAFDSLGACPKCKQEHNKGFIIGIYINDSYNIKCRSCSPDSFVGCDF